MLELQLHFAGGVVVAAESVCGAYGASSLCCVVVHNMGGGVMTGGGVFLLVATIGTVEHGTDV